VRPNYHSFPIRRLRLNNRNKRDLHESSPFSYLPHMASGPFFFFPGRPWRVILPGLFVGKLSQDLAPKPVAGTIQIKKGPTFPVVIPYDP